MKRTASCRVTATTCTSSVTAQPTRRWSCWGTARAAITASGSSKCRSSRPTTASSPGTSVASVSPRTLTGTRTRARRRNDLLAILDHLGAERAHVVGQSMGGWAAMGLAVEHADRVRSLVLADTLAGIPIEGWWKTAAAVQRTGPFNHPALVERVLRAEPGTCAPLPEDRRAPARPARRSGAGAAHDGRRDLQRRPARRHFEFPCCSSWAPTTRSSRPLRSRRPRPGSRAPAWSTSPVPDIRPTSSNPTSGIPWSRDSSGNAADLHHVVGRNEIRRNRRSGRRAENPFAGRRVFGVRFGATLGT